MMKGHALLLKEEDKAKQVLASLAPIYFGEAMAESRSSLTEFKI